MSVANARQMKARPVPARMLRFAEGDDTALPDPHDDLPASIARAVDMAKQSPAHADRFLKYARMCRDLLEQIRAVGPCIPDKVGSNE